jgi:hypothetical protein
MSCIELTVVLLSISVCHPDASPRRLPGRWVGAWESGGELKLMRAEFVRGHWGWTGALHLEGAGDLPLLLAAESRKYVYLQTRDDFAFAGVFRDGAIVGRVLHAGQHFPFELHQMEIDRRALR